MQILGLLPSVWLVSCDTSASLRSQAKGEEAVSIPAQPEGRPGSERGGRPEHHHGLRREAEGGTSLVCVRKAVSHQRAGERSTRKLLTALPLIPAALYEQRTLLHCYVFT